MVMRFVVWAAIRGACDTESAASTSIQLQQIANFMHVALVSCGGSVIVHYTITPCHDTLLHYSIAYFNTLIHHVLPKFT